jgi:hypothetical protein
MSTVYGYPVTTSDDYFVQNVQIAIENFSRAALPASEFDHSPQQVGSNHLFMRHRFCSQPDSLAEIRARMDPRCRMEAYNQRMVPAAR